MSKTNGCLVECVRSALACGCPQCAFVTATIRVAFQLFGKGGLHASIEALYKSVRADSSALEVSGKLLEGDLPPEKPFVNKERSNKKQKGNK